MHVIDGPRRGFDSGLEEYKASDQSLGSLVCNTTFRLPLKEKQG